MSPRESGSDDVRVRRLLRDIDSAGAPTQAERDRIRAVGRAALEGHPNGAFVDAQSTQARRVALVADSTSASGRSTRSTRGSGRLLLAAAASIVLVVGLTSFVLLRRPASGVIEVADAPTDLPVVVLPQPSEADTTRYTIRVAGLDVAFETDVAATFGEAGDDHAWIVATDSDQPFAGVTRYGQVLVGRPTSIFGDDPETWFESNGIDAQEVRNEAGILAGWSLIVRDAPTECEAGTPCIPFATFASGERPSLAAGVINEIRIVDVVGGSPFVVYASNFGPRGSTSFSAAGQLQRDIVRSLQLN